MKLGSLPRHTVGPPHLPHLLPQVSRHLPHLSTGEQPHVAGASGTKILKPPKVSTISGETQSFLPPGWVCSCCHLGTYPIVLCANTPSHSPLPFPDTQRDPWRLCRGWAPTASQLTVGKRGRLKQPQRPRRPPPPLRCLILTDPAAQPSLAIPLYTPRAGLWAGAQASKCP